jgi:hypothetical protein
MRAQNISIRWVTFCQHTAQEVEELFQMRSLLTPSSLLINKKNRYLLPLLIDLKGGGA